MADLLEVLFQFLLRVPPGEVRVGLLEARPAQRVHHGRAGKCLRQEHDFGVLLVDLGDQPFPEPDRLGVRIVHAEDLHPVADPKLDDPEDFLGQALGIVVEVERVDVLVLLGRVFGVGDAAVHPGGEPFRVGRAPRGGPAPPAARGPAPPPGPAPWHGPRKRRSPRRCRGPGGWRRGRPPSRRWPRAIRDRADRRSGCCWGPCGAGRRWGGSAACR